MEWLFLLLGIPVGIAATRTDVAISWTLDRIRHGRLRMSGDWAEWIERSSGRQFSLGTISYNVWRRRYSFDGTNYTNDGQPFCHWTTVSSHIDYENLEFHYSFKTRQADSLQVLTDGYGVVQLEQRGGNLIPADGYYIYSPDRDSALSFSHTLTAITGRPADRNANAAEFLRSVLPEHASSIRDAPTEK